MRTNLNYHAQETRTATVFLSNDHSLYAPMYLGWTSCLMSFVLDQSTCQERVESDKIQNEKFLTTVGREPTALRFEVGRSTIWSNRAWRKLYNCLKNLYTYMYFRYQCIHWYKFENAEVERILSSKCTVLCYILDYTCIFNVQLAKRRTSSVLHYSFQHANTSKHSTWSSICM